MKNVLKNSPAGFLDFGSCKSNIACIILLEALLTSIVVQTTKPIVLR